MKTYFFEVKADGSIGARYLFDTKGPVPNQDAPPGSTMLKCQLTGSESDQEREMFLKAKNRPEEFEVKDGKITEKIRSGRGRA